MADQDNNLNVSAEELEKELDRIPLKTRLEQLVDDRLKQLRHLGLGATGLGAFLIVAAFMFYPKIFEFIVTQGGDEFKKQIDGQFKETTQLMMTAKNLRNLIQEDLSGSLERLAKLNEYLAATRAKADRQMQEFEAEKRKLDDALRVIKEAKDSIDERVKHAQSTTSDVAKQVNENLDKLKTVAESQEKLLAELKKRDASFSTIGIPSSTISTPSIDRRSTVYFQFAGFTRTEAKDISSLIKRDGWSIPGEERTIAAIKTNEIRYNSENEQEARQLKKSVDRAFDELRTNRDVKLVQSAVVSTGTIELWLSR